MNASGHHHVDRKEDETNYNPILVAVAIVVIGICVGYVAVRCCDTPSRPMDQQAESRRSRTSNHGHSSSRIHDLQLHAQSPFDGVVEEDEEESEEEEFSEEEDVGRKSRPE